MNKKLKGFSLAELLISLLIISIALSATIPTLTRRSGANREFIWRWSEENNTAFFGVGANQSAIIGYDRHPINDRQTLESIINDSTDLNNADSTSDTVFNRKDIGLANLTEIPFNIYGDKLVLLKKPVLADNKSNESNFTNSHISFFTAKNSKLASTDDIKYAGRLAMDPGNIALGIGSLQNQKLDSDNANAIGENTAIGHFALLRNTKGMRNTAIGKKTLSANEEGGYNTAVGFGSLFELGNTKIDSSSDPAFENTAIGALSQLHNKVGKQNTSLGAQSLKNLTYESGDIESYRDNTAIGWASMFNLLEGSENTAIGSNSCKNIKKGSNNICIGANASYNVDKKYVEEDNYGLYIGSTTIDSAPLIIGHTHRKDASKGIITKLSDGSTPNFHQELIVNARNVSFRPYNGASDIFRFESYKGSTSVSDDLAGYDSGSGKEKDIRHGIAYFNLRDTISGDKNQTDETSVTLKFSADPKGENNKTAYIDALDDKHFNYPQAYADIWFNRMLSFKFPINCTYSSDKANCAKNAKVSINAQDETTKYPMFLTSSELSIQSNQLKFNSDNEKTKLEIKDEDTTSKITFMQNNSQNKINIQQDNSGELNIQQNSSGKFLLFQGSTADNSPRVQLDQGIFYVLGVKGITMKAETNSSIELGSVKINTTDITINGKSVSAAIDKINSISSDARLKNISGDDTAGLKEINALEVKNYTYKDDKEKTPHVGVIAQQLQKIFPDAVTKDDKGYLRIRTEDIFYAMVNSIKDLFKQLQDLTAKVTGLDKRITELEKQNKLLTEQNKAFEKRLQKLERQSAKTK